MTDLFLECLLALETRTAPLIDGNPVNVCPHWYPSLRTPWRCDKPVGSKCPCRSGRVMRGGVLANTI